MSKSDPASAIFMEDSEAEVRTKVKKAFAAPGEVGRHAVQQAAVALPGCCCQTACDDERDMCWPQNVPAKLYRRHLTP
jgi:tRNA synthetases class I (W and Y)